MPAQAGKSPVVQAMVNSRIVPSERAARLVVIALAVVGVSGAFTSIYLSSPNRGTVGVEYSDLTAAERAEMPAAERAYLEHIELIRREVADQPPATPTTTR